MAIIGYGSIGALIGAFIWGGITAIFGIEIGWIAWGIGGLVGMFVSFANKPGASAAGVAAVFTIVAICLGKLLAVSWSLNSYIRTNFGSEFDESMYQAHIKEAEDYLDVEGSGPNSIEEFLVKYDEVETENPQEVTQEDIEFFTVATLPYLDELNSEKPSYEVWKQDRLDILTKTIKADLPFMDRLKNSLGLMDLIFFILGVITAVKVATRQD